MLIMNCAKRIACSLVGCRFDYASATLLGVSGNNLKRLQCFQNTLACVVARQCDCISIISLLKELHWLPVKWRIEYKVATMIYKQFEFNEPMYLQTIITSKVRRRSPRSVVRKHWSSDFSLCVMRSNHLKRAAVEYQICSICLHLLGADLKHTISG